MTPIVKICGLSTPATLDAALSAGADMVGFVFFPKSPRHIGFETARVARRTGARPRADRGADRRRPTMRCLQASSTRSTPTSCNCMARRAGAGRRDRRALRPPHHEGDRRRNARGPRRRGDLRRRGRLSADRRQAAEGRGAARRQRPAVRLARSRADFAPMRPWLLSGGLDAANVAEAIRATGARGVDVSSGVESAPGVKDEAKIAAFVAAAREAFARAREGVP